MAVAKGDGLFATFSCRTMGISNGTGNSKRSNLRKDVELPALMNRTLVQASLHAKDALRSQIRISTCFSCSMTRNPSQQAQYHILRLPTTEHLSYFGKTVRLLSTKRARKSKGPKLLSRLNERYRQYPPLEGEQPPSIPRPLNEIQIEQREQKLKERVTIEERRISSILNKPPKTRPDSETSGEKGWPTPKSSRTIPSPEQKGVYSPSTFPLSFVGFIPRCTGSQEETREETLGRPPKN